MAAFVHGAEARRPDPSPAEAGPEIRSAQGKRASPQDQPAHEDQGHHGPPPVASQPASAFADSAGAGPSNGISSLGAGDRPGSAKRLNLGSPPFGNRAGKSSFKRPGAGSAATDAHSCDCPRVPAPDFAAVMDGGQGLLLEPEWSVADRWEGRPSQASWRARQMR